MEKQLIISYDPEIPEDLWDTSDALKDLVKRYDDLSKSVLKAERQLLKFDEINRLVAREVKEKTVREAAPKSGGSTKSSSKSTGTKKETSTDIKKDSDLSDTIAKAREYVDAKKKFLEEQEQYDATLPLYFTIKDVLFNWEDLNWEQIMMKIIAGLGALSGAVIGGMIGGVPGAIIGLAAGLLFGISMDNAIFNFDGELQTSEIWKSLLTVLAPTAGAVLGLMAFGPVGAVLGVTIGLVFSFVFAGLDWSSVREELDAFFTDLIDNFNRRWDSFRRLVSESIQDVKDWWSGLNFGSFHIKLPHIMVEWQELASDSALTKFLGIKAIPHLSVEWYAGGGIVDGPTLIGAGEKGKEAIIPLERNTGWIRMVAEELLRELEKLAPSETIANVSLPAAAGGSLVPPSASAPSAPLDLSSLADAIATGLSAANNGNDAQPIIRLYIDGKQISNVVTEYQKRGARAFG